MQSETSNKPGPAGDFFGRFAYRASCFMGSRWAFIAAVSIVAVWGIVGPIFNYSETWQLVINTATTVITFLMVFLIQNSQNRDARAINLKLNELIHAIKKAKNHMIDIENLSDAELDQLEGIYQGLRLEAESQLPDPALTDQTPS